MCKQRPSLRRAVLTACARATHVLAGHARSRKPFTVCLHLLCMHCPPASAAGSRVTRFVPPTRTASTSAMARALTRVLLAAAAISAQLVAADVYMHNPRGGNDRNCEVRGACGVVAKCTALEAEAHLAFARLHSATSTATTGTVCSTARTTPRVAMPALVPWAALRCRPTSCACRPLAVQRNQESHPRACLALPQVLLRWLHDPH